MTRQRNFIFFLPLLAIFILTGCTGGGSSYTTGPWVYKPSQRIEASKPPNPLSERYNQSGSSEDILEQGPQNYDQGFPDPNQTLSSNQDMPAQQPARPQLEPVKVALLLPLTGQHSALGQAMLNASQIALFDIGHAQFELMPRDTKGTRDGARDAARSAIDDGAELILGPVFADAVAAVKREARRADINVVAFSTNWQLAEPGTYLMGFLPFGQVNRIISYAAKQGIESIGVLAPRTQYAEAALQAYQETAARHGIRTPDIARVSGNSRQIDMAIERFAQYQERQQEDPETGEMVLMPPPFDALFIPAGGDELRSLSNLASKYGLHTKEVRRLGTGLWDDAALSNDQSLRGGWFAAPSPALRKNFEQRYREFYGNEPLRLASLAYDATALAAVLAQNGIRRTGRPDFSEEALTNPNGFVGIDGVFRFRPSGIVERGLSILEFRRGQIIVRDKAPQSFKNFNY